MKNGKQIMTVVYIPFANPPVLRIEQNHLVGK